MSRFHNEHRKMDPENLHQFLPRLQSKYPTEILSKNLLHYLKNILVDSTITYQEPLEPLYKGYERLLYTFHLSSGPEIYSKPLVLRLYQEDIPEESVKFECTIQQAILAQDFPVPEILHICKDRSVLGGYFFIMEKLKGINLSEYIYKNYHTITKIPLILAQIQLQLHGINPKYITNLLIEQGFDIIPYTLDGIIKRLNTTLRSQELSRHEKQWDWLITHQPISQDPFVICHSDLHFGNIIYDEHMVTGVVDWGKTRFCEREYDIAATILLIEMMYHHYTYSPQFIISSLKGYLLWMYLSEYRKHNRIDAKKIQYYKALIAFQEMISIELHRKNDIWYRRTWIYYHDQFEKSCQFIQ